MDDDLPGYDDAVKKTLLNEIKNDPIRIRDTERWDLYCFRLLRILY